MAGSFFVSGANEAGTGLHPARTTNVSVPCGWSGGGAGRCRLNQESLFGISGALLALA